MRVRELLKDASSIDIEIKGASIAALTPPIALYVLIIVNLPNFLLD